MIEIMRQFIKYFEGQLNIMFVFRLYRRGFSADCPHFADFPQTKNFNCYCIDQRG